MIEIIAAILIVIGLIIVIRIMNNSSINQETCLHKSTFIYTDSTSATCEKTTVTCLDCGKKLKTETDCR